MNLSQDLKSQGAIGIHCMYKVGVAIYDTTNRVDKVIKKEIPIIVRDTTPRQVRKNFVEIGQS